MKFPCTIERLPNGRWWAGHAGRALGRVAVVAASRDEALSKMRNELRYRVEGCPCGGVPHDFVELEVREPGSH